VDSFHPAGGRFDASSGAKVWYDSEGDRSGAGSTIVLEPEATMARKKKRIRILSPQNPPDSFTRTELAKVIKEVAAARRRRQRPAVANASK